MGIFWRITLLKTEFFSSFEEIPKELINCFLVSEDINFFSHIGIDYKGIVRAFFKEYSKNI